MSKSIKQRFLDLAALEAVSRDAAIQNARDGYKHGAEREGDNCMKEARKHSQKVLAALDCAKACGDGAASS